VLEGNRHDWMSAELGTCLMCNDSLSFGATRINGFARRFGSAPFGLGYEHRSQD
jgi:hypothetical protein